MNAVDKQKIKVDKYIDTCLYQHPKSGLITIFTHILFRWG